jgi:hydrogenase maturation protease
MSEPNHVIDESHHEPPRILILGLGNELLADDGAGVEAARALGERLSDLENVTAVEAARAGFALLDILQEYDIAYLIDAIQTGGEPGTPMELSLEDFSGSSRLVSQHDMDVATALEFGRRMGCRMPKTVRIWAVEAEDITTFREGCCEAVRRGVREIARRMEAEIRESLRE